MVGWVSSTRPAAAPKRLLPWAKIFHCPLDDGAQFFLLFCGGVNLDRQMPHSTIRALFYTGRVERPTHEAVAVSVVLAHGTGSYRARQRRCQGDGGDE